MICSRLISLILILLIFIFQGCDKEVFLNVRGSKSVKFIELTEMQIPPCLSYSGIGFNMVIADHKDYEHLRRKYAPQGEYESFLASEVDNSFQLSYLPLDTDGDDIIGATDIIINLSGRSFTFSLDNEEITIGNPFYIVNDSIYIFKNEPPYTVDRKIHHSVVFDVNPVNGKVTFNVPLNAGIRVSLSARRLFSTYKNRSCTMEEFNFSRATIIGKGIQGDGCLNGFDKEISIDNTNKQIVYTWWKDEDDRSQGCNLIAKGYESWIRIIPPPLGYEIVFEERILE